MVHGPLPCPLAGAAGGLGGRLRHLDRLRLTAGRCAARRLTDLLQFGERALAIHRALAIRKEGLPSDALRIGDPLLVGFGVAAGRVFGLHNRTLGAAEAVIDLGELGFRLRPGCRDAKSRRLGPRVC